MTVITYDTVLEKAKTVPTHKRNLMRELCNEFNCSREYIYRILGSVNVTYGELKEIVRESRSVTTTSINYLSLIKDTEENNCRTCDARSRRSNGTRCTDCPFIFGNGETYWPSKYPVFSDTRNYNKYQLFFFIDNPYLNGELPPLPDGESNSWEIHHINFNHHDDSKGNHKLLTKSEHRKLHNATRDDITIDKIINIVKTSTSDNIMKDLCEKLDCKIKSINYKLSLANTALDNLLQLRTD
jgi:hypothetical protein